MGRILRIGTRESQLAVWQSRLVQQLLQQQGIASELVYIKSEGDINTTTPLYEMGVQGIFTRALDVALLDEHVDIAVHSMKDVPVVLAQGIRQAAVLERGSYKDIIVHKGDTNFLQEGSDGIVASSSIRRIAQWLNRFPQHQMVSLRGNVNTRLQRLHDSHWDGAIFAAAGLERIGLRPETSLELDWMLPAPAQGAIMVTCRQDDHEAFHMVHVLDHEHTNICTSIERSFLRTLHGGCSSPVSALAMVEGTEVLFQGNIASHNGRHIENIEMKAPLGNHATLGADAAHIILSSDKDWIHKTLKR
jgi:hydroxymethylbilane synthase